MIVDQHTTPNAAVPFSKLVISDRLIKLAEDADRAGYTATAHVLVDLACAVFDEAPRLMH